jgi:hypothetical protein
MTDRAYINIQLPQQARPPQPQPQPHGHPRPPAQPYSPNAASFPPSQPQPYQPPYPQQPQQPNFRPPQQAPYPQQPHAPYTNTSQALPPRWFGFGRDGAGIGVKRHKTVDGQGVHRSFDLSGGWCLWRELTPVGGTSVLNFSMGPGARPPPHLPGNPQAPGHNPAGPSNPHLSTQR